DGEKWTAAGDLQPTPLLPRRLLASPRPALWFLGSLLLRTGVALTGFYLVGGGHWQRLLACLVGFVLARLLVTRLTRASTTGAAVAAPAARQKQEVDHAPQP
ncbi:ATP synthase subunit I, partial [Hydrogenophaga sp.]|uniref:N-ATPase subunit AtpR n=1 Tax=Hydrogenophaga sp. TaxID=1904254 RepID=UPI003563615F